VRGTVALPVGDPHGVTALSDFRQRAGAGWRRLVAVTTVFSEDFDRCYRAVRARDARFDGWFVTAVLTTRVYCRPSCPARTPYPQNVRFFATAAAAHHAGFRACKRCRPDASPGSPEWNARADVVARAMRLVADGVVDREGVGGVARRLGYSERQLHRQLVAELGVGLLALARAQRAQTARVLIETTDLPFAQVAFAAGFGSIRQFNDTVREVFAMAPGDLRHRRRVANVSAPGVVVVRLPYREPFAASELFEFLAARAIEGVEDASARHYRRTLRLAHGGGVVTLRPGDGHVLCELRLDDVRDLATAVARSRALLDLDADPVAVDEQLGRDAVLGPWVRKTPGIRVPGTVDGA
jgi:AraC family transcriptional regulator of adaptative response / DNA-3-methyladenine glycosylase II